VVEQWFRVRTTNLVERLNEEIQRRNRMARLFPNEASCLRLVSAVLMEIAEDWQTGAGRLGWLHPGRLTGPKTRVWLGTSLRFFTGRLYCLYRFVL
jgi:hypothetical protein